MCCCWVCATPVPSCALSQVFNVPGRCYPVDIIHSQEDHMQDYVAAAIDTALQIHLNQSEGETQEEGGDPATTCHDCAERFSNSSSSYGAAMTDRTRLCFAV